MTENLEWLACAFLFPLFFSTFYWFLWCAFPPFFSLQYDSVREEV